MAVDRGAQPEHADQARDQREKWRARTLGHGALSSPGIGGAHLDDIAILEPGEELFAELQRLRRPPVAQHGALHLFQRRHAGGLTLDDAHEVHAVGGLYGSGPRPGRKLRKLLEEALSEHAVDGLRPREAELSGQERALAQGVRVGHRVRLQRAQRPRDDGRIRTLAEVDLLEGQAWPLPEGRLVRGEIGLELPGRGTQKIGAGVRQEFHLLPEAPADHRVVAIEAERQRFAVVDLLAHEVVDDRAHFIVVRRSPPDRLETLRELLDALGPDDNRLDRRRPRFGHRREDQERQAADRHEVKKRLPKEPRDVFHVVGLLKSGRGRVPDR